MRKEACYFPSADGRGARPSPLPGVTGVAPASPGSGLAHLHQPPWGSQVPRAEPPPNTGAASSTWAEGLALPLTVLWRERGLQGIQPVASLALGVVACNCSPFNKMEPPVNDKLAALSPRRTPRFSSEPSRAPPSPPGKHPAAVQGSSTTAK